MTTISSDSSSAILSNKKLAPGKTTVRFEFAYAGGGPGKGGKRILCVNNEMVAEGHIERRTLR